MGYGGPVWHASVATHPPSYLDSVLAALIKTKVRAALEGVGDAELGEWLEVRPTAVHLRRRLSYKEAQGFQIVDIRGTPEAERRLAPVRKILGAEWSE